VQLEAIQQLTESVRKGGCANDRGTLSPEDPIWVDFARGMAPLMFPASQAIAQMLKPVLSGKQDPKVLDIAAGHGTFGIAVAQGSPTAQIYAVDWANVLQVATENAQKAGVAARHHLIPGSAFDVDFGAGYEAALLTNLMHHFDPPTNEALLRRVHAALAPGGRVVILEFVPNPDRVSPPMPALFSITMLTSTPHGDAFTFAELSSMCHNSGFTDVQITPLPGMPQALVTARKA